MLQRQVVTGLNDHDHLHAMHQKVMEQAACFSPMLPFHWYIEVRRSRGFSEWLLLWLDRCCELLYRTSRSVSLNSNKTENAVIRISRMDKLAACSATPDQPVRPCRPH